MKNVLSILFVVLAFGLQAQGKNGAKRNKLDSIRTAYINTNLPLSAEEQAKFWPVYDEMRTKMRDLNKKELQARKDLKENVETLSEADIKTKVETLQSAEQDKLNIKKEYASKIANIITWKKSVKLVQIEKQFKEKLREELQKRKGNRPPNPDEPGIE